ncbi:MAG: ATP-binding cassette domain-containing protein, partial [Bacteroidota bacterium]
MNEALLSVSGLQIVSGDKILVDRLSLTIRKGTTMGIVGESGSGKTLTALSLLRLLPPGVEIRSGQAELMKDGQQTLSLFKLDEKGMNRVRGKEIAMIFQEPMTSLNPSIRCGLQVSEGLELHLGAGKKEARERVLDLFNEVRLPDPRRIYRSWPHQLSGGQRQRVMIAMALAMNPSLLIADEPTTALDVTVQKKILSLLKELQEKHGLSILFISHDLMVVRQIAHDLT